MKKIFVAGHNGMVGRSICRYLTKCPDVKLITSARSELDLCDQAEVIEFMERTRPDEVILAAAKVGGIQANNSFPAEFIYQNLQIQNNVIHGAHLIQVDKLLFLGSSCIYPKFSDQPIIESELLNGKLEPTNEPYAIAKIAGIKMCESYNKQYGRDYRCVMPTNLYGPGDNYHTQNSHVVPALLRRMHEAKINNQKEVEVWGSGSPMREFLYVDDMASACVLIHNLEKHIFNKITSPNCLHINVGFGSDLSIAELAHEVKNAVGYKGKIVFDRSKPDGTPRKLLDISKLELLGWQPKIGLREGLKLAYKDFLKSNCL